jgi:hypothetical protein
VDRRDASRKKCQEMGISADEMPGCIFDNGFLNLTPSPTPIAYNPTRGSSLKKLDKTAINNNFGTFDENLNSSTPLPLAEPKTRGESKDPINKEPQPKSIGNRSNENQILNNGIEIKTPKAVNPSNNSNSLPNKTTPVQKPNLNGGGVKVKKG